MASKSARGIGVNQISHHAAGDIGINFMMLSSIFTASQVQNCKLGSCEVDAHPLQERIQLYALSALCGGCCLSWALGLE